MAKYDEADFNDTFIDDEDDENEDEECEECGESIDDCECE
jgi:hypothetical protein